MIALRASETSGCTRRLWPGQSGCSLTAAPGRRALESRFRRTSKRDTDGREHQQDHAVTYELVPEPDVRDDDRRVEERQHGREREEEDEGPNHAAGREDDRQDPQQSIPRSVDADEAGLRVGMHRQAEARRGRDRIEECAQPEERDDDADEAGDPDRPGSHVRWTTSLIAGSVYPAGASSQSTTRVVPPAGRRRPASMSGITWGSSAAA